jgi:GAF domain-containing protein
MDPQRFGDLLRLLATAGGDGDDGALLRGVCDYTVGLLSVTGAGVMVMLRGEHHRVLCASDAAIGIIEELQDTAGTGPCLEAYRSGRPVSEPDLATFGEGRWPGFGARAVADGIRSVFSFPLTVDATPLGALDLYADQPGELTADQRADAATIADVVAHIVTATYPLDAD